MTVIDNAIYVGGKRVASPTTLARTADELAAHGGFAWIGLYRPEPVQLNIIAKRILELPSA